MRTSLRTSTGAGGRPRRGSRVVRVGLIALLAALALPGVAGAATHPAKVGNITITPALAGHQVFGLYHFTVSAVNAGDSFAYPFSTGPKIGHCVEATALINSDTGLLRTGDDLSLANNDAANTLGTGLTVGAQQLEWILLDSYKNSPGDATGVEGAAHQSAIWQLTNPSSPSVTRITGSLPAEQATAARTTQLVNDAKLELRERREHRRSLGRRRRRPAHVRWHEPHRHGHGLALDDRDADAHGRRSLRHRRHHDDRRARRHRPRRGAGRLDGPGPDRRVGDRADRDDGAGRQRRQPGLRLPRVPARHQAGLDRLQRLPEPAALEDRRPGVLPHLRLGDHQVGRPDLGHDVVRHGHVRVHGRGHEERRDRQRLEGHRQRSP